jgi:uncharacterized protein involved in propanediol utilization
MNLNQEQLLVILRASLTIAGSILVTHGLISSTDWATIAGALLTIAPVLYGIWANRKTALIAKAATLSEVEHVALTPTPAGQELAKTAAQAIRGVPDAQVVISPPPASL